MPIRINLLAEDQFLAEMRRRDPVKRAAYLGGVLVVLMFVWWGWLLYGKSAVNTALEAQNASFGKVEKRAKEVADYQKRTAEIERNIHSLHRMATNRVLWSSCMDALQECTLPQVQITRVRVDQNYQIQPAVVSRERGKSKPAASTEMVILVITARDYGRQEDRVYQAFKDKIENHPWFKRHLTKENSTRFRGFSNPTPDKDDPTKVFVTFTMECLFPEQFRN